MPGEVAVQLMAANVGYGPAMNQGMRYWRARGCAVVLLCTHDVEITAQTPNDLVTVVAGPLNWFGVNPKIKCSVPAPSK